MFAERFETERLEVRHWSSDLSERDARLSLEAELTSVLTPAVLAHLPPPFALSGEADEVTEWITARTAESDVYLVARKSDGALIGLLLTASMDADDGRPDVHIGYLLAETAWGQGFATELLRGLLGAAANGPPVRLIAGVGVDNPASSKVLRKAGFELNATMSSSDTEMFVRILPRKTPIRESSDLWYDKAGSLFFPVFILSNFGDLRCLSFYVMKIIGAGCRVGLGLTVSRWVWGQAQRLLAR